MVDKQKKSDLKDFIYGTILFFLVTVFWYLSWQYIDNSIRSTECGLSNTEARGLFGDKFGAINALFSALAFAGIIFTIFLQKRELRLQREEMEETREEFIKQNATLIQQKFENTFFQMLKLLNSIIDSIDLQDTRTGVVMNTGRDCFKKMHSYFKRDLKIDIYGKDIPTKSLSNVSLDKTLEIFDVQYGKYKSDLSHYFRTLYHLVKFIDQSDIENKKQYTSLVRAQLSSYEQVLLFYNCLHPNGKDKFKPLIEKYSLLKNIDQDLIMNADHKQSYKASAFGT